MAFTYICTPVLLTKHNFKSCVAIVLQQQNKITHRRQIEKSVRLLKRDGSLYFEDITKLVLVLKEREILHKP